VNRELDQGGHVAARVAFSVAVTVFVAVAGYFAIRWLAHLLP
jgi:hypothetical protein